MANRLTTIEELQALPDYTPILGHATVPVLAHRSPNGVWWSTVKTPIAIQDLVNMCTEGFVVLHDDDQQVSPDLQQVLTALETLEFFAHFEPVDHEDRRDTKNAAALLRAYFVRNVGLSPVAQDPDISVESEEEQS